MHYGRSRLFAPTARGHALCSSATTSTRTGSSASRRRGTSPPSLDLSELISLCGQARAEGRNGDGAAWAATAAHLGAGGLDAARDALRLDANAALLDEAARESAGAEPVERALAAHALLVG